MRILIKPIQLDRSTVRIQSLPMRAHSTTKRVQNSRRRASQTGRYFTREPFWTEQDGDVLRFAHAQIDIFARLTVLFGFRPKSKAPYYPSVTGA